MTISADLAGQHTQAVLAPVPRREAVKRRVMSDEYSGQISLKNSSQRAAEGDLAKTLQKRYITL
jgi:hypothetical protein